MSEQKQVIESRKQYCIMNEEINLDARKKGMFFFCSKLLCSQNELTFVFKSSNVSYLVSAFIYSLVDEYKYYVTSLIKYVLLFRS